MGRSAGTGSPVWFSCAACRRRGSRGGHNFQLTGRTKPYRSSGALGSRSTATSREYRCTCGHVGWSNHIDLERFAVRQGDTP